MGAVSLPPLSAGAHYSAPRRRCAPTHSCCLHEPSCTGAPGSRAQSPGATCPASTAPTAVADGAGELADSSARGTRACAGCSPSSFLFLVGPHPLRTPREDAPPCAPDQPCRVRADTIGGTFRTQHGCPYQS